MDYFPIFIQIERDCTKKHYVEWLQLGITLPICTRIIAAKEIYINFIMISQDFKRKIN